MQHKCGAQQRVALWQCLFKIEDGSDREVLLPGCHGGAGGSFTWADLDTGLAVSLCHNRMHGAWAAENPLMPIAEAIREIVAERAAPGGRRS